MEEDRETYATRPLAEEMARLSRYLESQSKGLQVIFEGDIPEERYVIPHSLVLIVQHAQQHNVCTKERPLQIIVRFLEHTIEVINHKQPKSDSDESYADLDELVALYRQYFSLPLVRNTDKEFIVSIPLFI